MHELGIVFEIARVVEDIAKEQNLSQVDTIVLQIGQLSAVVPKYIEECYPAAVDGTFLEKTKLEIEIIPGNAICRKCGQIFNVIENKRICPKCGNNDNEIISGTEFNIKEIRVPED